MRIRHTLTTALAAVTLALAIHAADWPQYRGPAHDGSTTERIRTNWNVNPPRVLWRKSLSPGWSSIVVGGGRAFTQVRRVTGNVSKEFCVALDAATGVELWSREVDTAAYSNLAGYDDNLDGPRSTPSIDGDRVFVLTSLLKLVCLRADTGAQVWRRDFVAEFPGTPVIEWQNAASPLVIGDLIHLNANVPGFRLTAVRKLDGGTAWRGQNDGMTHATPVWTVMGGVPQVVHLTASGMVSVEPASGAVLWRYPFTPSGTSTAATPIASGDLVYASAAYGRGAWTARVRRAGEDFSVSETNFRQSTANQNHWASPILHGGRIYSIVERSVRSLGCYDPIGRTNAWTTSVVGSRNPGYASLIKADDTLVVLTEGGELVLVAPDPTAYREIARFQALTEYCWNHPVISNGRLYARSSSEMVALEVGEPKVPFPAYRLAMSVSAPVGVLRVNVRSDSAAELPTDAGSRLTLQFAETWRGVGTVWLDQSVTWTRSGPEWGTQIESPVNSRVFRVIEKRSNP